jgi:hypothetical protein
MTAEGPSQAVPLTLEQAQQMMIVMAAKISTLEQQLQTVQLGAVAASLAAVAQRHG